MLQLDAITTVECLRRSRALTGPQPAHRCDRPAYLPGVSHNGVRSNAATLRPRRRHETGRNLQLRTRIIDKVRKRATPSGTPATRSIGVSPRSRPCRVHQCDVSVIFLLVHFEIFWASRADITIVLRLALELDGPALVWYGVFSGASPGMWGLLTRVDSQARRAVKHPPSTDRWRRGRGVYQEGQEDRTRRRAIVRPHQNRRPSADDPPVEHRATQGPFLRKTSERGFVLGPGTLD